MFVRTKTLIGVDRTGPLDTEALCFGARTLLLSTFAVALGAPWLYVHGMAEGSGTAYACGGVVLPVFSALLIWRTQWGPISVRDARRIILRSLLWATPALILVLWIVSAGQGRSLVGVSIMSFIAALVLVIVSQRQRERPACVATISLTVVAIVATPAIILSMTQILPHGLSVITGWAIPVSVAVMGAMGAASALRDCARVQAEVAQ